MKKYLLLLFISIFCYQQNYGQTTVKKVVLQAFWWDYYNSNYHLAWADYITELAPRLREMGIDAVWIPPTSKNESPSYVGYGPFDHYDLGDKWQKGSTGTRMGDKNELLRMIAVLHANGIEVIQDVVLNHTMSAGSSTGAGGKDPNPYSVVNAGGYKNFRYVSYTKPANSESLSNYWNRNGRWPKNFTNFYPNQYNNCTSGDICEAYFGPDISYESNAIGPSSNVTGYNPNQPENYMRNEGRNWMMWLKKQTAVDGFRWDAVKHFPTYVQEDYSYNVKYLLPDWAKGGEAMFNVGEWVGSKNELDNYVQTIAGNTGERMMGAFDFNLRAFDPAGGLYGMVYGMGNFNMASLPASQQDQRVHYYSSSNTYVHRTVSFVNNHDTFRPQVDANGNYSGWNTGSELSAHIDPTEPRLSTAYAVIMAMDGNPQIFFEDLFNIGTQGNRYNHDPKSYNELPANDDLINLMWCHQNLDFKSGGYQVPFANEDYLVIARAGKAIIGITDHWSNWQNQWVYTGFSPGTVLKDYSGANGSATVTVNNDGWAPINTPPVNPSLNIAGRHGYSIWAPIGQEGEAYEPTRAIATTQEWEMANDLGDRHPNSLGQGGAIPANSTAFRTAGKIYVEEGKPVTYILYPENPTKQLLIGLYDSNGAALSTRNGSGTLQGTYTPSFTGWITLKVKNRVKANPSQRCWVNVTYTAPAKVTDAVGATAKNTTSIWTGNEGTDNWNDKGNWEEGILPYETSKVLIPEGNMPYPKLDDSAELESLRIEPGASLILNSDLYVNQTLELEGKLNGKGSIHHSKYTIIHAQGELPAEFSLYPNPSSEGVSLIIYNLVENADVSLEIFGVDGKLIAQTKGNYLSVKDWTTKLSSSLHEGVYIFRCQANDYVSSLRFIKTGSGTF